MRFLLSALLFGVLSVTPAFAQPTPSAGVTCVTVAARQPLPDNATKTFRAIKMTIAQTGATHMHRHKSGEIIYLLSGAGTNTMNGKTKALSADKAIVIPPRTFHVVSPTGGAPVTILAIQFSNKTGPAWEPRDFKGPSSCHD